MKLRSRGDYVVRNRTTGVIYLYRGRKAGVSSPRVLGEGLGVYDLGG